ncbi:F-box/WD repeat-containing protein 4, partial [Camelus dromedarius]
MASVPVKERVRVSQNWKLGRCREGILLKWRCSQMPWMQLEGDSLYISQANFILAYQFRPDGASLNRRPLGVFAGHDEDVCHFVLANSHIISAGGDGKIGIHKVHSTFTVKYSAHEQEVNCVDCKGGIIVSGSRDRTAKVRASNATWCIFPVSILIPGNANESISSPVSRYGLWPQADWGSAYTPSRLKTESGPLLSAHCS